MGTPSAIWREKANGLYDGIICQLDGNIENMGFNLYKYFSKTPCTTELIKQVRGDNVCHISSLNSHKNYSKDKKRLEDYLGRLEQYEKEETTYVLRLKRSGTQVVYYGHKDRHSNKNTELFKEKVDRLTNVEFENIRHTGFDYYQKLSGKWFVDCYIAISNTEEYINVSVPLKELLMLYKKGYIIQNTLKLKNIYNKEVLDLFVKNNERKSEFVNFLREITLKNVLNVANTQKERDILEDLINTTDISSWVKCIKALKPNIEFYEMLEVFKDNKGKILSTDVLLRKYIIEDLSLNYYQNSYAYKFVNKENIIDIIKLYGNVKEFDLYIVYSDKEEIDKYTHKNKSQFKTTDFEM